MRFTLHMAENPEPDDRLVDVEHAIDELHRADENAFDRGRFERARREWRDVIAGDDAEDYWRETDQAN